MRRLTKEEAVAIMRAAELEPLEPYPGSGAPWRCRCLQCGNVGHPRLSGIRSGRQGGCKPCGYARNARESRMPEDQAVGEMRAAGLEPTEPYPGSNKPWQCRCLECGTVGAPMLASIRQGQGGCKPCGHRRGGLALRVSEGEAEASMRAANLEPLEPYPGLHVGWKSRCMTCGTIGHPWLTSIRSGIGGCRPCGVARGAERRRVPEAEAIADMRAAGLEPFEPYPNAVDAPWRCRCTACGTVGAPRLANIRKGAGGCKPCGRAKAADSHRVPEAEAAADMRAAGLEPLEPYPGIVTLPWLCRCTVCETITKPTLNGIRNGQGGCKPCGDAQSAITRRMPEALAIANMAAAGLIPLDPYVSADTPWRSSCMACGTVGAPRLSSIRQGNGGCNACGRIQAAQSCRVPDDQAVAEMREAGYVPLQPYPGGQSAWLCRHNECGTTGYQRLVTLRQLGRGTCRVCAVYGFDWDGPALIYILTHPRHKAHKFGITGLATKRLADFKRNGWHEVRTFSMADGASAYVVEQTVKARLIQAGISMINGFLSRELMPRGGHTETVDASAITVNELERVIRAEIAKLT